MASGAVVNGFAFNANLDSIGTLAKTHNVRQARSFSAEDFLNSRVVDLPEASQVAICSSDVMFPPAVSSTYPEMQVRLILGG